MENLKKTWLTTSIDLKLGVRHKNQFNAEVCRLREIFALYVMFLSFEILLKGGIHLKDVHTYENKDYENKD